MVDRDGTGDGDGGNDIWVMGTPIDDSEGKDPVAMSGADGASGAYAVDDAGGTAKVIGAEGGSEGMPP
jgi:hypothetical protein